MKLSADETIQTVQPTGVEGASPVDNDDSFFNNWCVSWQNLGNLYSNPDNRWIQGFNVKGRFQYQYGYVDGDDSTDSRFIYDTTEIRRFFVGAGARFLRFMELQGQLNIMDDQTPSGGDREFQLEFWDLNLTAELEKALHLDSFDTLVLGYGRRELQISGEFTSSSKLIKTVERSAIANKVWPDDDDSSNPTGGWLESQTGPFGVTLGVFSTTTDKVLAGWSDGQVFYGSLSYDLLKSDEWESSEVIVTGFYQNVDDGDETLASGLEWATSAGLHLGRDRWSVGVNALFGDNGEQPDPERASVFWGAVLLPTYWIWREQLEGVFRYQYQGSKKAQGIILNSRYVRRAGEVGDATLLNGGRGDRHHSFYIGLNYYLCGDNLKFMLGEEYDHIQSKGLHVYDGWTTFLAMRVYF